MSDGEDDDDPEVYRIQDCAGLFRDDAISPMQVQTLPANSIITLFFEDSPVRYVVTLGVIESFLQPEYPGSPPLRLHFRGWPLNIRNVTIQRFGLINLPLDHTETSMQPTDSPALTSLLAAMKDGAKDGAAASIATGMTEAFLRSKLAAKLPALVTGTDAGKATLTFCLPVAIFALTYLVPDAVPRCERVRAISLRAIRGYTVIAVHDAVRDLAGGFFTEILGIAAMLDDKP